MSGTAKIWYKTPLVRVFSLLGRTDTKLVNPRAYLIRTATNLWIDRVRRSAREQAALALEQTETFATSQEHLDGSSAAKALFQFLHPQERAALVMKDVFDFSLEETAELLNTTSGAVKSALSRARGRLEGRRPQAGFEAPPRELVARFMLALAARDIGALRKLCAENMSAELVGGVEMDTFEKARTIFEHAHLVMPRLGFGASPRWEVAEYEGEPIGVGFRTLDGVEGLNEIHRFEVSDDRITIVRTYCFCPETLKVVADALGWKSLPRPYRSPSVKDFFEAMLGAKPRWRQR
jgi:RNA polymerase sigma-70 factor (ECF subfamily)